MTAPSENLHIWVSKSQLTELVAQLCRAMDRGDRDGIATCYAEDSYDDHGAFKGTGAQLAEYLCAPGPVLKTHHQLGQSIFDVTGDEAWGETYFVMFGLGSKPLYGRYVDYYQRREDTWRVKYRRVVPEVTITGDDIDNYWRSSRDHHDPAYDRLRTPTATHQGVKP